MSIATLPQTAPVVPSTASSQRSSTSGGEEFGAALDRASLDAPAATMSGGPAADAAGAEAGEAEAGSTAPSGVPTAADADSSADGASATGVAGRWSTGALALAQLMNAAAGALGLQRGAGPAEAAAAVDTPTAEARTAADGVGTAFGTEVVAPGEVADDAPDASDGQVDVVGAGAGAADQLVVPTTADAATLGLAVAAGAGAGAAGGAAAGAVVAAASGPVGSVSTKDSQGAPAGSVRTSTTSTTGSAAADAVSGAAAPLAGPTGAAGLAGPTGTAGHAEPAGRDRAVSPTSTPGTSAATDVAPDAAPHHAPVSDAAPTAPVQGQAPVATDTPTAVTAVTAPSAPTTPVAAAGPVAVAPRVPEEPQAIAQQLGVRLGALRTAPLGEHILTLRVEPDSIGPVRVVAHIAADGVRIELTGATDHARDALRQAMPDLRRDLAATGLQADLDLGEGSTGGQAGFGEADRRDAPTHSSRGTTAGTTTPGSPARPTTQSTGRLGGLDLLV